VLVTAVALAAWVPALAGGFRYDDFRNVVHDPATRDGAALLGRLPHGVRPLTRLSYFLDHAAWGLSPRAFLATNLALHLAASLMLLALVRRRLASLAAGVLAGALFAAQPAGDVAVAYVSGRSAVLSAALLLGGLLVWDRAAGRSARAAWGAVALFALATLARETALVFPLLVLLWEATRPDGGEPLRRRLAPLALPGGVAVAATALLIAVSARYRTLAAVSLAHHDPGGALAENLRALPVALSLWARPGALAIEHPPPPAGAIWIAAGAALALGLIAVAIAARRKTPQLALAAGWILVVLLPTHTLLARSEAVTQRPLYLAWVGPALLAGAAVVALAKRVRPALLATAAAGLVLATTLAAHDRARLWTDDAALWRAAVDRSPGSPRAWNNLGAAYLAARDYPRARASFRVALELDPKFPSARAGLAGLALVAPDLRGGGDPP
jgi:tetratricopeptide (TPR) repeat protein